MCRFQIIKNKNKIEIEITRAGEKVGQVEPICSTKFTKLFLLNDVFKVIFYTVDTTVQFESLCSLYESSFVL